MPEATANISYSSLRLVGHCYMKEEERRRSYVFGTRKL